MGAAPRFAPDPHRRGLIAKIHIAKKDLALDEDTYRGILVQVTGLDSAAGMNSQQLSAVLTHMAQHGFKARSRRAGFADHPMAKKARALWISLYQLGVVHNASEHALEAFAKKQLGCEKLQWAPQGQGAKLIEALKGMAERGGWAQTDGKGRPLTVEELKAGLAAAIALKRAET